MSSLIDKIRTLINAQVRGPRPSPKTQAPAAGQPSMPPPPASPRAPEVTEGRPRKPRAEVSEATPAARQAAAPKPAASAAPAPSKTPGGLDESRIADMLKQDRAQ